MWIWEEFKLWLLRKLIGEKKVIANCTMYDTNFYTQKFYYKYNVNVESLEKAADKRAVKMVEKRDNEMLIKQGVQRYGNSFVLRSVE